MSTLSSRGRGKIRAPRRGLTNNDTVDFDVTWGILEGALREIHAKNASKLSFEELYRNAYKLVLKKKGEELYNRVSGLEQELLRENVRNRVVQMVTSPLILGASGEQVGGQAHQRRADGERFLGVLKNAYKDHDICMKMITDVLMYMERTYCQDERHPSIYAMAMALFRTQVLRSPATDRSDINVMAILESAILDMIAMERKNEIIDRPLIRACICMLEELYETFQEEESSKLYLTSFEPKFLESSRVFYHREGQNLVANADAGTFCRHARKRLREEDERCQQTLSTLTDQKIKSVVDKELIGAHIRDVINMEGTGVKHMLDNDRLEDLSNVFDLNSRVDPKKAALKDAVQKRIVSLGSEINNMGSGAVVPPPNNASEQAKKEEGEKDKNVNQQTASAIKWVDDVLTLKTKYDRIWEEAFKKDSNMEKALEYSFQEFINANQRSSEHLSLYLDEYLKKGAKGKTDLEVDANLDKGILLLQYIQDKDHFENYYKKHLSKRLLQRKSASMDIERQMISKMKMKVGNTFTQRLESMFKDMALSEDLTKQYKTHVAELGDPDTTRIDLEASILTTTMWPVDSMVRRNEDGSTKTACIYPPVVENVRKRFEHFYLKKHSGRTLSWQPQLGSADIRATFTKPDGKTKRHELNVSTYAMVILLLFNDLPADQCLSYEEIQARTSIPENELCRNLQSLAVVPKTRILKKDPMSKDIKAGDKFYFNESFTSPYMKVKVGVVSNAGSKAENSDERRATKRKADEERGTTIEAAVVRIMKQRKHLAHQQLIAEVIQQLANRFQPDVNMIKQRIESLMEREYLERGPDPSKPSYTYLA
ncbi:hypothetical protein GJ744_005800 [Endocarpon pusillum]|uniref:Cullin family profile domain-containing protein n=1 Tax=Endocarpon pusillum TaxID=364733 RepID=A0A8H7A6V3_9EURO|nr:hypothetical protein GJ744_005800 [Endocarpon pusillum]